MNTISNTALDDLILAPDQKTPKKNDLGEDEFLKLMLTQLQHQDPFQPMENGEFIAQMAQFSSVQGINTMADSMQQLTESFSANQALQAASLVGHDVLVGNNFAGLKNGDSIEGSFELFASTGAATINIYDTSGNLVHQDYLGQKAAGQHSFSWDGALSDGSQAPEGTYEIRVDYSTGDGTAAADVFIQSTIQSVNFAANGSQVILNTDDGQSLGILDIRQIQ